MSEVEAEIPDGSESALSKAAKAAITIILMGVAADLSIAGMGILREYRFDREAAAELRHLQTGTSKDARACLDQYTKCKTGAGRDGSISSNFYQAATSYPPDYAQCARANRDCLHLVGEGATE
jgi:ATP phosphoribosyltransferase